MAGNKDVVTLSIDRELLKKLKEKAKEERRSLSNYTELILDKVINGEAER